MDKPARETTASDNLSAVAWVYEELRKTLDTAHKAIRRFIKESDASSGADVDAVDPAILRTARSGIHQGVGALELVGMPEAATLLRASEAAVQRLISKPSLLTPQVADDIERASFALIDFLARRLAGKPVSPISLFPRYEAVQKIAAADRAHPADLWSMDWEWKRVDADPSVGARVADGRTNAEFEQQMLNVMRGGDTRAYAAASVLCAGLASGTANHQAATLWSLAAAVFESQASGILESDVFTKRVASRLLSQLRMLQRGDAEVSERLALDLLFFCSQARKPSTGLAGPRLAAVQKAFGLGFSEGPLVDYHASSLGRHDPSQVAQARKRVAAAKESWSAVSGGELHRLGGLLEQFSLVGDSLRRLLPGGDALAQQLSEAALLCQQAQRPPATELAMEVATSYLYVDALLEEGDFDGADQADRIAQLAHRIQGVRQGHAAQPLEPWMEELYRRVSDRQTIGSVVQELRSSLADVEKRIDQFHRAPQQREPLFEVPRQLTAMRGVLSVLGVEPAVHAIMRMRDDVESLVTADSDPLALQQSPAFERLATNTGALSFLIDLFNVQPQVAKSLFVFDETEGTLQPVMGRSEVSAPAAQVDSAPAQTDQPLPEDAVAELASSSLSLEAPDLASAPGTDLELDLDLDLNLDLTSPAGDVPVADQGTATLPAPSADADSAAARLPAATPASAAAPVLASPPAGDLDDDAEMREIFLEEAREVIDSAAGVIAQLRRDGSSMDAMTTLRRAFHTLKGSSRMVGLREFGEAAWACEQVFNARLATHEPADAPLLDLSQWAMSHLGEWVDELASQSGSDRTARPVQERVDRYKGNESPILESAVQVPAVAELPPAVAHPAQESLDEGASAAELAPLPADTPPIEFAATDFDGVAVPAEAADQAPEPLVSLDLSELSDGEQVPAEASPQPAMDLDLDLDLGLPTEAPTESVAADLAFVDPLQTPALELPIELAAEPAFEPEQELHLPAHEQADPESVLGSEPQQGDVVAFTDETATELSVDGALEPELELALQEPDPVSAELITTDDLTLDLITEPPQAPDEPVSELGSAALAEYGEQQAVDVQAQPALDEAEGALLEPIDLQLPPIESPDSEAAVIEPLPDVVAATSAALENVPELADASAFAVPGELVASADAELSESLPVALTAEVAGEGIIEPTLELPAEAVAGLDLDLDPTLHEPAAPELAADLPTQATDLAVADAETSINELSSIDALGADATEIEASNLEGSRLEAVPADSSLLESSEPEVLNLEAPELAEVVALEVEPTQAELSPVPILAVPEALNDEEGQAATETTQTFAPAEPSSELVMELAADVVSTQDDEKTLDLSHRGHDSVDAPELAEPEGIALDAQALSEDEQVKVVGPLRIGIPLFNIYLAEADEISRRLGTGVAEWASEPQLPVGEHVIALAHSLGGSSATVGFTELSQISRSLEHALMDVRQIGGAEPADAALFVQVTEEIRHLLHQFAAGFLKSPKAELTEGLAAYELRAAQRMDAAGHEASLDATAQPAEEPLEITAGSSETAPSGEVQAGLAAEPANAFEQPAQELNLAHEPAVAPMPAEITVLAPLAELKPLAPTQDGIVRHVLTRDADSEPDDYGDDLDVEDAVDAELFPIFEEEAQELLPQLASQLRDWIRESSDASLGSACMRTLHTLKGGARLAGAMRLGELAHRLESGIEDVLAKAMPEEGDLDTLQAQADVLAQAFESLRQRDASRYADALAQSQRAAAAPAVEDAQPERAAQAPAAEAAQTPDAPALADVQVSAGEEPAHAPVHEPVHEIVEAPTPESVPQQTSGPLSEPAPARTAEIDWARFAKAAAAAPRLALDRSQASQAQSSVRVRSPLLDRLVNQAGEVSITRARIEAEVGQIRNSLSDLTDNLNRLRGQLRDIDLQAETQMSSRMEAAKAADQAFDPLEFDRFTRFQELTRMMAESVNDVATVQRALLRTLESAEDALVAQARLTRDLQSDLLRTRMVEFEGLSDRLYRVIRQAAKETGKQVRLDIVGGSIEVDRGVLDRMTPAFEHILRNSVTHGIESAADRAAKGKDAVGTVTVSVGHQGNEVAIEFRDDGAGLDLMRIRDKGISMGLLDPHEPVSDAVLANLIFTPGFSTADKVTELAGRGVGMDVVRNEVTAMGGRIETATSAGYGTSFRLQLPLTTAVTQVVMMRMGDSTVAVPSTLIEIVRRAKPAEIDACYQSGTYNAGDAVLPFFWLGALLQHSPRSVDTALRTRYVVIVRSAQQRVAIHVDEVLGNQEVVVKSLGPQLGRMPGLAGMTLLASGGVALIYNPVALASVYAESARAATLASLSPTIQETPQRVEEHKQAVAPLILVVDDSLTVRRVTQRLLAREGYRVVLAKDGLDALEKLAAEKPELVLSDIEMPRMDGFDLVRNIRGDANLADLPVIMITSRIAQKHRDHAAELGVNHYLGKPYSEDDLLALVARYTGESVPA